VTEPLPAEAAIERIKGCLDRGEVVLGVEGFELVPQGYKPRVDLILDLSGQPISSADAAAEAEAFVRGHAGDGVLFEVTA
jgi:hypothetical protein